jgi:signal transduction histidine kinase
LHERIDLQGPADEIKELADTFDEMLARLDRSFSGQRHFVGNASHELRTPLAIERTLLEVAIGDPEASTDLKTLGKTILEVNARSERLIEALLTLASTENEISERHETDLQELAATAIRHNTEDAGELRVTTSSDGHEATLEVSNTGQSVAEHDLERMFEPFVRLARERTGTSHGLGLSIVRSVAHSHGGSVSAKARDGGGLIVTVRLPVQPLGRP